MYIIYTEYIIYTLKIIDCIKFLDSFKFLAFVCKFYKKYTYVYLYTEKTAYV